MSSPNADRPAPETPTTPDAAKALRRKHARQAKLKPLLVERLFKLVPLHPVWTGVIFAVATIFILTLIEIITGRMSDILNAQDLDPYGYFFTVLHLVLLGYAPTALVLIVHAARRNARALTALIEPSDAALGLQRRMGQYDRRALLIAGAVGVILGVIAPTLDTAVWLEGVDNPYDLAIMTPEVLAQRFISPLFAFFTTQFLFVASLEAWRFNRLARYVKQSDLLDPHCLDPFTRQGLTNVLIVAIFPAILLFFVVNEGLLLVIGTLSVISAGFAIAGLMGPLLGIHARVAAAKTAQLNWVNGELTKERTSLQGGAGDRFVSLMSYRSYIESVREWPLDGSTLGRLALYLAIPFASWVGGALVERVVDAALG